MSPETTTRTDVRNEHLPWKGGIAAGLAGGVVFGTMLSMMMPDVMRVAIPSMYGMTGIASGWVAHLFHSAVIGVVLAAVASAVGVAHSYAKSAALGAVYGAAVWLVLAAFVMPVWLDVVGSPANPPLPNFNPMSLVGHLVYGVVAGAVLPAVRNL